MESDPRMAAEVPEVGLEAALEEAMAVEEEDVEWEVAEEALEAMVDMVPGSKPEMTSLEELLRKIWLDAYMNDSKVESWTPAGMKWKASNGVSKTNARELTKTSGDTSL